MLHAAGVQQCVAHLFRHLQGVLDLHPTQQAWAGKAREVLREAHTAVEAAKVTTATELDPVLLAGLRARYDKAVTWGNHQPAPRLGRQRQASRLHSRHTPRRQSRPGVAVHDSESPRVW